MSVETLITQEALMLNAINKIADQLTFEDSAVKRAQIADDLVDTGLDEDVLQVLKIMRWGDDPVECHRGINAIGEARRRAYAFK